jgi:type IV pilus assembly protein PilQ
MKTFRRLILVSAFAAVGIGLALGVGLSLDPAPRKEIEIAPGFAGGRVELGGNSELGENSPSGFRLPPGKAGGYEVHPYPALGAEAPQTPAEATDGGLLKSLGFLKGLWEPDPVSPDSFSQPGEPIPPPPAEPRSTITRSGRAAGDDALTITIRDEDIRTVLDLLSQQGNLNILASANVKGTVSATLSNVDVLGALDAILKSSGYRAKREGAFLFVGTAADFEAMENAMDTIGTRVYHPNYVKASELQALITPILTEGVGVVSVTSDAETGIESDDTQAGGDAYAGGEALLVRDYEAVLIQIDQLVEEIDVRPLQVHIEAMILSVNLDDENRFGVNFELLRRNNNIRLGWGTPASTLANFKFDHGGLKFAFLDENLGAFLDALETIGDLNVIATPRLMVLNKHRAEIQIGESKGYVSTTQTETATTQSVEFLELGTLLRLRPFISSDGLIRLEVHPELSDGDVKVEQGFTLPNKKITQVTTNVMVRDGCTVVIGGLIKDQLQTSRSQIPLLGNLPIVGVLFRSKKEIIQRQEIVVLLTPRIVYEPETCHEGDQAACEFHRRHTVYAEKMSSIGKRSLGRRYFRRAQHAWAVGDRDKALRQAEMAVQFDPLNRAAIDLRSDIWLGRPPGEHTLLPAGAVAMPPVNSLDAVNPLDAETVPPWVLEDLGREVPLPVGPVLHPLDPGQPGRHRELEQPRRLQ